MFHWLRTTANISDSHLGRFPVRLSDKVLELATSHRAVPQIWLPSSFGFPLIILLSRSVRRSMWPEIGYCVVQRISLNSEIRHALHSRKVITINSHRSRRFLIKDRPITRTWRTLWHLAHAHVVRDKWEWKPIWEVKMSDCAIAHCEHQEHSPQPCWPLTMLLQQSDY